MKNLVNKHHQSHLLIHIQAAVRDPPLRFQKKKKTVKVQYKMRLILLTIKKRRAKK